MHKQRTDSFKKYGILFLVIFTSFFSCGESSSKSDYSSNVVEAQLEEGYADGTWCADVEYYNPNTGTRNTYQLDVEVQNNELTEIEWPNGGWLDASHFTPEDISDGECSFTSDRGYEYTVTLNSEGGCGGSDAYRMRRDMQSDKEEVTCPNCGDEKYSFDDLCSSCERKKEEAEEAAETCPVCNGYKMEWEKMCSSCKEDKEDKEERGGMEEIEEDDS